MLHLHTGAVRRAIESSKPNRVLQSRPPLVADEEKRLPRAARTKLAQLRTGFSPLLNSYTCRIDHQIEDKCPDCRKPPHDTRHLFNCDKKPRKLTAESLWTEPVAVAAFGLNQRRPPSPSRQQQQQDDDDKPPPPFLVEESPLSKSFSVARTLESCRTVW